MSAGSANTPAAAPAPQAGSARLARLARFGLVGAAGSVVYFALLWTLVEWVGLSVMASTSIAFVIVVLENYVLHRHWTFRSIAPHGQALPRFLFMSVLGFWVNGAVMSVGVQRLGLNYMWVQAVAIAAVVSCNFAGTCWIFRRRDRARPVL